MQGEGIALDQTGFCTIADAATAQPWDCEDERFMHWSNAMPTAQQQARLRALEAATEHRAHCGVILYRDRADVPDLIAEAQRAGHIAPDFALLVLPMPRGLNEWQADAEAHRLQH